MPLLSVFASVVLCLLATVAPGAATGLEHVFSAHAKGSAGAVDHAAFDALLKAHVKTDPTGLNRVDYAAFKATGHARLKAYVQSLEAVDVLALDRPEQFAFWANLYNAKTIDIILDRYPVKSIRDINLGGSLAATVKGGPWAAKVAAVGGHQLSLDDIEHAIMRKIFKDPRVHYAVSCASIGCPNLGREAFVGVRLEAQLDAAARAFVNSPRGFRVGDGRVWASSIYNWFQEDFGDSAAGVLEHARRHAEPPLKQKLAGITVIAEFGYDWSLNDAQK